MVNVIISLLKTILDWMLWVNNFLHEFKFDTPYGWIVVGIVTIR